MKNVRIIHHPLLLHKLNILRDENTGVKEFRDIVSEMASLMFYEVTRDLPLKKIDVKTPVTQTSGFEIEGKTLTIVPILRAGLGMVEGIVQLLPTVKIGHIGLFRDPETLLPVEYYCKLPTDIAERQVIILDPMLATGGSAVAAIDSLKKHGATRISVLNLLAAPEGLAQVMESHPDVTIYCVEVDECLNDHGYIVPGLGDAGDRIFGTK